MPRSKKVGKLIVDSDGKLTGAYINNMKNKFRNLLQRTVTYANINYRKNIMLSRNIKP